MKFQKKPVTVDAYQTQKDLYIHTLEGIMHASPGDWIITGINGEQYPCKPDILSNIMSLLQIDFSFLPQLG